MIKMFATIAVLMICAGAIIVFFYICNYIGDMIKPQESEQDSVPEYTYNTVDNYIYELNPDGETIWKGDRD